MKGGNIFLIKVLKFIYSFCRPACAKYHQSGCKGIKSAGMSDLEFLYAELASYHYPDLVHQVKGCPVKRLVKHQDLSFLKNRFPFFFHPIPAKQPAILLLHNILRTISACCASRDLSYICMPGNQKQMP